jgi:hypothetical protein
MNYFEIGVAGATGVTGLGASFGFCPIEQAPENAAPGSIANLSVKISPSTRALGLMPRASPKLASRMCMKPH